MASLSTSRLQWRSSQCACSSVFVWTEESLTALTRRGSGLFSRWLLYCYLCVYECGQVRTMLYVWCWGQLPGVGSLLPYGIWGPNDIIRVLRQACFPWAIPLVLNILYPKLCVCPKSTTQVPTSSLPRAELQLSFQLSERPALRSQRTAGEVKAVAPMSSLVGPLFKGSLWE